ncbi:EKC/KEOPS complex subunit CGI121, putative [Plasmodium ovale]|uniref:EKC/KEOPS complex subunit CGI121 n=2 Tax=Plasmodium ovale TaxID=36330 RepID=A0A1A8XDU9_PLAOA|nr:hypothetical protein POVCU2_0026660 [Plasmodium ovale curtisi]SBT02040.1 hypothetical protein POVCU1_072360 [Plasmodium ovale curtisi]SCQ16547.1 EKC/KEOPS complex subunit CGI121, putative [Plasmodium ovale]
MSKGRRVELYIEGETVVVTLVLFKNVTNGKTVLNITDERNPYDCAVDGVRPFFLLMDSRLVFSDNHILHSIYRGIYNFKTKKKITKNVILEIFFFMSPHENMNECLTQYKVKSDTKSLIYVGINVSDEEVRTFTSLVEGEEADLEEISTLRDDEKIGHIFKCTDMQNLERYIYHNVASKKVNLN